MRGETQAASLRAYNLSILPEIPGGYGTGTDNFATFADGKSHTDATLYPNDNGQAMKRKDLIVIVCALALLSPSSCSLPCTNSTKSSTHSMEW